MGIAIAKVSKKALEKKLDTVFSQYIRLFNSDEWGFVKCCTCNKIDSWDRFQNGHFINRWELATRWHEKNCHPQCEDCNRRRGGNLEAYKLFLVRTYGEGTPEQLKILSKQFARTNITELEVLFNFYSNRVNAMKKDKSLSD